MPTKLRRLTIALPPAVDAAVTALAEVEGKPHSKVIVEYLAEVASTMLGVAKIGRQVKAGRGAEAKRTMQHVFGDQLADMMQVGLDLGKSKRRGR